MALIKYPLDTPKSLHAFSGCKKTHRETDSTNIFLSVCDILYFSLVQRESRLPLQTTMLWVWVSPSYLFLFLLSVTLSADLFDILLPMLNIYQEFVRNHQYSLQVLANCKQNRDFDKLLKQYESNAACEGRMLETFLTYPMSQVFPNERVYFFIVMSIYVH